MSRKILNDALFIFKSKLENPALQEIGFFLNYKIANNC